MAEAFRVGAMPCGMPRTAPEAQHAAADRAPACSFHCFGNDAPGKARVAEKYDASRKTPLRDFAIWKKAGKENNPPRFPKIRPAPSRSVGAAKIRRPPPLAEARAAKQHNVPCVRSPRLPERQLRTSCAVSDAFSSASMPPFGHALFLRTCRTLRTRVAAGTRRKDLSAAASNAVVPVRKSRENAGTAAEGGRISSAASVGGGVPALPFK